MLIRYSTVPVVGPWPHERLEDHIPLLRVRLEHRAKTSYAVPALLDSGAPFSTFDSDLARSIGLRPEAGRAIRLLSPLEKQEAPAYLHNVQIHVEGYVYSFTAAFSDYLTTPATLGRVGFFDHYRVVFDPDLTLTGEPAFEILQA